MPAPLIPIIMLAARIGGKKAIQSAIKRVSKGRAAQLVREGKARYAKEVEGSLGDALTKAVPTSQEGDTFILQEKVKDEATGIEKTIKVIIEIIDGNAVPIYRI